MSGVGYGARGTGVTSVARGALVINVSINDRARCTEAFS